MFWEVGFILTNLRIVIVDNVCIEDVIEDNIYVYIYRRQITMKEQNCKI